MPYEPPRSFGTTTLSTFADKRGFDEVGALSREGLSPNKRFRKPRGELEENPEEEPLGHPKGHFDRTSNNTTFVAYGKLPDPNKLT